MQYKFKACPFCGTKPKHVRGGDDGDGFIIFCNCGACRDFVQYDLTEAWNRRPLEDALHSRIAELEKALADILECPTVLDCDDYQVNGRGYDCEEVEQIIKKVRGK